MRETGALRYMLPWMTADLDEIDEVFGGDPWPDGIDANRKTLEALVTYLHEQGLIAKKMPIEDIFVKTFEIASEGRNMADVLKQAYRDLVIANRVLANQGVVDAYGHVSIRHPEKPDHFLLSRSRSPELVTEQDIMEFTLDGTVVGNDKRPPYLERFIHGCLYEARAGSRRGCPQPCRGDAGFRYHRRAVQAGHPCGRHDGAGSAGLGYRRKVWR